MEGGSHEALTPSQTATYAVISVLLVLAAGIFSGLTLSIFSIDVMQLKVFQRTGTPSEAKKANRLLALIEHHHLVLVSLLVSNAACMTALPIFLEPLMDPITSLIVSVTAVLFFGEVFPQATFVRNAITVSAFFTPLVWVVIVVTFIVSYPFGKILDFIVGHESAVMKREQLGEFLRMHAEDVAEDTANNLGVGLTKAEVAVMQGALRMSTQRVADMKIVKPADVFMLSSTALLDRQTLGIIQSKGFSRIPVYRDQDRKHILGVLLVKSLLPLVYKCPDPPPQCGEYPLREVVRASTEWTVQDLYEAFQETQTHMAVVYNNRGKLIGIATLEDVFELLHSISLNDEYDGDRHNTRLIEVLGDVTRQMSKARLKSKGAPASLTPNTKSLPPVNSTSTSSFAASPKDDESTSLLGKK